MNHCKACLWGQPPLFRSTKRYYRRFNKLGRPPYWPKCPGYYRLFKSALLPWRPCTMDHRVGFGRHKDEVCENYLNLDEISRDWWMSDALIGLERMDVPVGYITLYPDECITPRGWARYSENGMHDAIIRTGEDS